MDEFDDKVSPENVIVVGVDGSEHSTAAVTWAAAEAHRRRADVRLMYAWSPTINSYGSPEAMVPDYAVAMEEYGQSVMDQAVAEIRAAFPDLAVSTSLVCGLPTVELLEQSQRALMTVVGAHGSNRILGMLVGSVALRLASHGAGPIVVVRNVPATTARDVEHPVMVGLDGSDSSHDALAFAFEEASFRRAPLVAVRTWAESSGDIFLIRRLPDAEVADIEAEQHRLLAEQLAGWSEKYPDVDVRPIVVKGPAAAALLGLGEQNYLLPATPALTVVGSRGHGGFTGLLLGSVGQALIAHATSPICIVHSRSE